MERLQATSASRICDLEITEDQILRSLSVCRAELDMLRQSPSPDKPTYHYTHHRAISM